MNEVRLRLLVEDDAEFLKVMFLETIFWRSDRPRRSFEDAMTEPSLAKYLLGWGRPGDSGVVALSGSDERVGAAWYRIFSEEDQGYGFVSPDIPELGIATTAAYRGRGIGRTLMQGLIQLATSEGRAALSLSVEVDNWRALDLYLHLGFRQVAKIHNSWTMLLTLDPAASIERGSDNSHDS